MGLISELGKIQGIAFSVGLKEKILKVHNLLALKNVRFK